MIILLDFILIIWLLTFASILPNRKLLCPHGGYIGILLKSINDTFISLYIAYYYKLGSNSSVGYLVLFQSIKNCFPLAWPPYWISD